MSTDRIPVSGLDRRWMGANGVILLTGVRARPVEQVRALLSEFLHRHPGHALACRIDRRGHRWVQVPASDRAAHVNRLVIAGDDPDPEDLDSYIRTHIAALDPDLPFVAAVGRHSFFIIMCHCVGDGVTLDRLAATLLAADAADDSEVVARLAAMEPRMEQSLAVRELLRGLPRHRQDWFAHVPNPLRRRSASRPQIASRPAGPPRPAFAASVVTNEHLRALLQWRNRETPEAGIAAVLTSATYLALVGQGLDLDGGGYYAILDLRQCLPGDQATRYGNGAKSLFLTAELDDPQSISTALQRANDARRVVPAVAIRSPMRQRQPAAHGQAQRGGRLTLTFTFQSTLLAVPRLPVAGDLPRRMYGFGTPASPGGLAVFAIRLREHLQFVASFDATIVPTEAVRRALASLTDPRLVLEGSPTRLASG